MAVTDFSESEIWVRDNYNESRTERVQVSYGSEYHSEREISLQREIRAHSVANTGSGGLARARYRYSEPESKILDAALTTHWQAADARYVSESVTTARAKYRYSEPESEILAAARVSDVRAFSSSAKYLFKISCL